MLKKSSGDYNPSQHPSIHHLKLQYEQRDIHPCFQQSPNQLHTNDELYKKNRTQNHEQQLNKLGKLLIGDLNVNVLINNISELLGLTTTKYLY